MRLSMLIASWTISLPTILTANADDSKTSFYSQLSSCPAPCAGTPQNWTLYNSFGRLGACNEPVLLDFNLHNSIVDSERVTKLMTCSVGNSHNESNALVDGPEQKRSASCLSGSVSHKTTLDLATTGGQGNASTQDLVATLSKVGDYLSNPTSCGTFSIVGYYRKALVGVYIGAAVDSQSTSSSVIQRLTAALGNAGGFETAHTQLCSSGRNANHTFGIVFNTNNDIAIVQNALASWSNATCLDGGKTASQLNDVSIFELPVAVAANGTSNTTVPTGAARMMARATLDVPPPTGSSCRTINVASGDGCGSLASECGISSAELSKFNPQSNLCSTLQVGQRICCTAGSLPDITPKSQANGTCATYVTTSVDLCSSIAQSHGLTTDDISKFNDGTTYGWFGCDDLVIGLAICLSEGNPPLPAKVANALCGPTAPDSNITQPEGTTIDRRDLVDFSQMNPCPLNACCDIWGQCGITPEYCTDHTGPTGNPGTAPKGENGCIANCGTKITESPAPPGDFKKIGYYESWNWDRPCLNMLAADMDGSDYTHSHWGFATITDGLGVSINDTYNQFDDFKNLATTKRIISFGGWGYSTDPATYDILRKAMEPGNADTFASNIVNFLNGNNLDGVDFDWEYPGAPDIPGIPPGLASDGPNYLTFLQTLRSKMPSGKTISIAAPASFWYLKSFPIAKMAKELDYIVYMTYDLHGQWDYNNDWAQEGCKMGNCLRSHVNLTETNYVLAMITKAGVPSSLISVGVSSYGRAFGMTDPSCDSAMCTYGGPDSMAVPGKCTQTAGYIGNAEILDLISSGATQKSWYDSDSNSDLAIYNNTWVAYMTDNTKSSRTSYYQGLNFGGTVDWAVDLQTFNGEDGLVNDNSTDDDQGPFTDPPPCTASYATIEDLDADAGNIPENCKSLYIVSTLSNVLSAALQNYTDMMNNGYDDKFNTYSNAVADNAGQEVRDFQNNNGNKYFTCLVSELTFCCAQCSNNQNGCAYCFNDGPCTCTHNGITGQCTSSKRSLSIPSRSFWDYNMMDKRDGVGGGSDTPITHNSNESEPCPPDYSKRGYAPDLKENSVYWTLNDDTADDFYSDLLNNTGIPKDKISFQNYDRGNSCAPSAKPDDDCWGEGYDYGMATPVGYDASDVTNPKDLVQQALNNSNNLAGQIKDAVTNLELGCYYGDSSELVDALSIPVLMIAQAVDSMSSIEATADQIDEEKRKAIILAFIGAILFFIPVVGEVVGAVTEATDIAAIIAVIGAAGNAAMDVYTIVSDPQNAPLAIFSLILAPLAIGDLATITKAANIRRGMKDSDIVALGGKLADRMGTIKKITGTCSKS
ncbi:MAG: hypothetical protein M1822_008892 [Bathelium mastoideum]|nr:MAG: hypothetical protein M1822_008892 [Bathelium mastoideum]